MAHEQLRLLLTAVFVLVERAGHAIALDDQFPRFDLEQTRAELQVLPLALDRQAALQRERHRRRCLRRQGIQHALPEEGALLEDRNWSALEQAVRGIGEARDA